MIDERDKHLFSGPQWYDAWLYRVMNSRHMYYYHTNGLLSMDLTHWKNFPWHARSASLFISHWNILHRLDIGEPIIPDDEL